MTKLSLARQRAAESADEAAAVVVAAAAAAPAAPVRLQKGFTRLRNAEVVGVAAVPGAKALRRMIDLSVAACLESGLTCHATLEAHLINRAFLCAANLCVAVQSGVVAHRGVLVKAVDHAHMQGNVNYRRLAGGLKGSCNREDQDKRRLLGKRTEAGGMLQGMLQGKAVMNGRIRIEVGKTRMKRVGRITMARKRIGRITIGKVIKIGIRRIKVIKIGIRRIDTKIIRIGIRQIDSKMIGSGRTTIKIGATRILAIGRAEMENKTQIGRTRLMHLGARVGTQHGASPTLHGHPRVNKEHSQGHPERLQGSRETRNLGLGRISSRNRLGEIRIGRNRRRAVDKRQKILAKFQPGTGAKTMVKERAKTMVKEKAKTIGTMTGTMTGIIEIRRRKRRRRLLRRSLLRRRRRKSKRVSRCLISFMGRTGKSHERTRPLCSSRTCNPISIGRILCGMTRDAPMQAS